MVPSHGDTRMGLVNGAERQNPSVVPRKRRVLVWRCHPCLTWMAPRFSISCSGLEDPRSTELTPSFLRHHAGDKAQGQNTHCSTPSSSTEPLLGNNHIICLTLPPLALPGGRHKDQTSNPTEPAPCPAPLLIVGLGFPYPKDSVLGC